MKQSTYLRRLLGALTAGQGWRIIAVDTGDGEGLEPAVSVREVMTAVEAVEAAHVFFARSRFGKEQRAWVFLVWQGPDQSYQDGEEILSDYTVNLSPLVGALAATLAK